MHKILKGHANDKGLAIKDLKINVTGHSMGGALASIAALCLIQPLWIKIQRLRESIEC
uniref:lipase family protein n=1 Tax=Wolbachia endosymbiont (group B) of Pilophorus perplexus TaxID=3066160 RepID=UPI00333FDC04